MSQPHSQAICQVNPSGYKHTNWQKKGKMSSIIARKNVTNKNKE